ncbi:hypothetical protein ACHMW4_04200 [Mesorhizobium sp. UC22_110]|uniref:hypothetical protein n=1 Tax=unclassified Mesorhizobium TaxID=325217 RepID=UPI00366CE46A
MITTFADLIFALLPIVTGMVGYALGRAASRNRIAQRQAAKRDLAAELRSAVDLEPCEFTAHWQVRP